MTGAKERPGKVYLVGAGPGDPGLLTLRGAACLARADLVLYDYLVNASILDHASRATQRISLGRHGLGKLWTQDEINACLVAAARAGQTVVRLKGGDPSIFARGAEEVQALRDQGIAYEIVPGISAAVAAASYAGVPITHRALASAVAFVTGHEQSDKADAESLDFDALARFPGTLVIYMGVTTAADWSERLRAAGKPGRTPVVVVRRCSFPDQQVVTCRLDELAQRLTDDPRVRPPAVVIVGEVAAPELIHSWFEQRPLFGTRVLVTRPQGPEDLLEQQLTELGAAVLRQPAIRIAPPADWSAVDRALARLGEFDWLVFSSANGVRSLLDRLLAGAADLRRLGTIRLAAIGPGTAEALQGYRLRADLVPPQYQAESLAAALADQAPGRRFLLARASRGRAVLRDALLAAGAIVEEIVVYQSCDVEQADAEIQAAIERGDVDWITVTSSAIARSLVRMFGPALRHCRLASISPITTQTLRECGLMAAAEADPYTMPGLVAALCRTREHPGA